MTARDVNEFIDGPEHEAAAARHNHLRQVPGRKPGDLSGRFTKQPVQLPRGQPRDRRSRNAVSPGVFHSRRAGAFTSREESTCRGTAGSCAAWRNVLQDYTTLYCHIYERKDGQPDTQVGLGYLKFRTFEDLAAVGNLVGFLASFQVTGTNDPASPNAGSDAISGLHRAVRPSRVRSAGVANRDLDRGF